MLGFMEISMKGVFGLVNGADLHRKLLWEHSSFLNRPTDPFAAYNFFVTAWHLLEWAFPGSDNASRRAALKKEHSILRVCEHLAVGAKHFEATRSTVNSVVSTRTAGVWSEGFWAPGVWAEGTWETWLEVSLQDDEAEQLGRSIKATDLATRAVDFWATQIDQLR